MRIVVTVVGRDKKGIEGLYIKKKKLEKLISVFLMLSSVAYFHNVAFAGVTLNYYNETLNRIDGGMNEEGSNNIISVDNCMISNIIVGGAGYSKGYSSNNNEVYVLNNSDVLTVEGGNSSYDNAESNKVLLKDSKVFVAEGAYSTEGSVISNNLFVDNSIVNYAYGGRTHIGGLGTEVVEHNDAINNRVLFDGSSRCYEVVGGSTYKGLSEGNLVIINGNVNGRIDSNYNTGNIIGGYSYFGSSTNNEIITKGNLDNVIVKAGYSGYGNSDNNKLTVQNAVINDSTTLYGGYSLYGNANNNNVDIHESSCEGWVVGGYVSTSEESVSANGNVVVVKNSKLEGTETGHSVNGSSNENKLYIKNSIIKYSVRAGYSQSHGEVKGSYVSIEDSVIGGAVFSGQSIDGNTSNSVLVIANSAIDDYVCSGYSQMGKTVIGNSLMITDSIVKNFVAGGYAPNGGTAYNNTVTLNSGVIEGNVYCSYANNNLSYGNILNIGGYVDGGNKITNSNWNVNVKGTVYGGNIIQKSSCYTPNELNVFSYGNAIESIASNTFDIYNLYVPESSNSNSQAMLSLNYGLYSDNVIINTILKNAFNDEVITLIEAQTDNNWDNVKSWKIDGVECKEKITSLELDGISNVANVFGYDTSDIKKLNFGYYRYILADDSVVSGRVNIEKSVDGNGKILTVNEGASYTQKNGKLFDVKELVNNGTINFVSKEQSSIDKISGIGSTVVKNGILTNYDFSQGKLEIATDATFNQMFGSFVVNGDVNNYGSITLSNLSGTDTYVLEDAKNRIVGKLVNNGNFVIDNTYLTIGALEGNQVIVGANSKLNIVANASILRKDEVKNIDGNIIIDRIIGEDKNSSILQIKADGFLKSKINAIESIIVDIKDGGNTCLNIADNNDLIFSNFNNLYPKASVVGSIADSMVMINEGRIIGESVLDYDKNGKLTVIEKPNRNNSNMIRLLANDVSFSRMEMNDIRKRLGDIRINNSEDGIWARYENGKLSGSGLDKKYNKIQIGSDKKVSNAWHVGEALSYIKGSTDYSTGYSNNETLGVAAYGMYSDNNSNFADIIVRAGGNTTKIKSELINGEFKVPSFSVSGEVGHTIDFAKNLFIEPQAELSYTYSKGDELRYKSVKYALESSNSLVGRLGFSFGYKNPKNKGILYTRFSLLHEFVGDNKLEISSDLLKRVSDYSNKQSWIEFILGGQINISKATYVYIDLEKTFGADVNEKHRINVGLRYGF